VIWQEIQRRHARWDIARRVRKHGWTGVYVYPGDDADAIALSYSIGFWEAVDAPEVVMFGMTQEVTSGLLWKAFDDLQAGALTFVDSAIWELDWEGAPAMAWRAVHPSQIRREHLNVAIWYRERQGFSRYGLKAYQLVVADTAGKFPWEEGYDTDYRPRQPELYLPYFGPPEDN